MKKVFCFFFISLFLVSYSVAVDEIMTLLTDEEGAMKEAPSDLFEVGRSFNDGPEIEVVVPGQHDEYKSPVKIVVVFLPRDGKSVDLSKLKVEALKFITINITKRVLPYTTSEGIKIENAKLPKGKHKLRITISDVEGGTTQETFVVKVL